MKRWTLALISIVLVSSAATAQTEPRLARLQVKLWPEYDRPAVLVILHGWLAADAALPATVRLPMPARAGQPHAVAKRATGGTLLLAQHTIDVQGDWATVNLMTDVREVRLEYYVDLATTNPTRRHLFEWPGGLDVGQVSYEVMQPIGTTDFSVKPPPKSQGVGNDGLTYYLGELGPKTPLDAFTIAITYTKTTPTLTVMALRPTTPAVSQTPPAGTAPSGTPATPAATPSRSGGANMWLLALVMVFGAALGGLWVFILTKNRDAKR